MRNRLKGSAALYPVSVVSCQQTGPQPGEKNQLEMVGARIFAEITAPRFLQLNNFSIPLFPRATTKQVK